MESDIHLKTLKTMLVSEAVLSLQLTDDWLTRTGVLDAGWTQTPTPQLDRVSQFFFFVWWCLVWAWDWQITLSFISLICTEQSEPESREISIEGKAFYLKRREDDDDEEEGCDQSGHVSFFVSRSLWQQIHSVSKSLFFLSPSLPSF